ncbi:MAG: sigma 54-interacting transcriptional regulator, partial [Planctomycetota bacterium]|nr:sigma 54-interacting transcriptional regulator [Planctomycetota bacterium]
MGYCSVKKRAITRGTNAGDDRSDEFLDRFLPGKSPSIVEARRAILKLNESDNRVMVGAVLLTGEPGSGKTRYAKVLAGHREWLRQRNSSEEVVHALRGGNLDLRQLTTKYVEQNVPGLPDTLLEVELFGSRKGAFTGATDREGLLGQGATDVLLDEIGDASPAVQAKLLNVIESRQYRPVGGNQDDVTDLNARLYFATNQDLPAAVRDGDFREDLLWRISQVHIKVPALREQRENIPDIVTSIELELSREIGGVDQTVNPGLKLSKDEVDWACQQSWPGNCRQLRHAVVRWRIEDGKVP